MVLGALMACLVPAMAQQDWQSTSTMKGAGSSLAPQVTAVGAAGVSEMATTTNTSSTQNSGPFKAKRTIEDETDPGIGNPGSPVGDALLPLMLMATAFGGVVALRRRRAKG